MSASMWNDRVKRWEELLADIPFAQQAATILNVRPILVPILGITFVMLLLNIGAPMIVSIVGFAYPAWQSLKVCESGTPQSARRWLVYWVVYTALMVLELFDTYLLFWIPFYYLLKLAALLWLSLDRYKGSLVLYDRVISPLMLTYEPSVDDLIKTLGQRDVGVSRRQSGL